MQQLLENDDPDGDLAAVVEEAKGIEEGNGRYTYVVDVVRIATDGDIVLDAKSISDHFNGKHRSCRTS